MADRILVLRDGQTARDRRHASRSSSQPEDDYTQQPDRRRDDPTARAAAAAVDGRGDPAARSAPARRRLRHRWTSTACRPSPVLDDVSLKLASRPGARRDRRVRLGQDHAGARDRRAWSRPARGPGPVRRQAAAAGWSNSARASELRRIQIVFQMADTALNPSHTIADILARPLQLYHGLKGEALDNAASAKLLDLVQLPQACARAPARRTCRAGRSSA